MTGETSPKIKRCAIYTRKSSSEGLDQEFNSLDAQRESAEAYIASQKHDNWKLIPEQYNDGGYSGGSLDRPALQKLLDDIEKKTIDIVVVYKLDRLSRSLNDFAKIAELFEKNNVSFVSITQQFNTTTSMGRLMLNILLSFAQFEREVAGDRIRDKITLAKKRGKWTGGRIPIGYNVTDKKLQIDEATSELVKLIFTQFVQLKSITQLSKYINENGYLTRGKMQNGKYIPGKPFNKGSLYRILRNRLYIGETRHKNNWYPTGEHDAIIDRELFNNVQTILEHNRHNTNQKKPLKQHRTPAPLAGLLFGPENKKMTHKITEPKQHKKHYRYYVSSTALQYGFNQCPIRTVRAENIEKIVFDQVKTILRDPTIFTRVWKKIQKKHDSDNREQIYNFFRNIDDLWDNLHYNEQVKILHMFIKRVQINVTNVTIDIRTNGIRSLILRFKAKAIQTKNDDNNEKQTATLKNDSELICVKIPVKLGKNNNKQIIKLTDGSYHPAFRNKESDTVLANALARSHKWQAWLTTGKFRSLRKIGDHEQIAGLTYILKILRLATLAPDIQQMIIEGTHPPHWNLTLFMTEDIPAIWADQREKFMRNLE